MPVIHARVVAVRPETQTVDIIPNVSYLDYTLNKEDISITRDVPYCTEISSDQFLPYEWNLMKDLPSQQLKDQLKTIGESFAFGRAKNPAYLEFIHDRFHREKGSHYKVSSGGIFYRPQEGSIALYDTDINTVIGFVSAYSYFAKSGSRSRLVGNPPYEPEFDPAYHEKLAKQGVDLEEIAKISQESLGYDSKIDVRKRYNDSLEKKRKLNPSVSYEGNTDEASYRLLNKLQYPTQSPYQYWAETEEAHIEDLSEAYIKRRRNEYKRLNEIYQLSLKKEYTSLIQKRDVATRQNEPEIPIFEDNEVADIENEIISMSNLHLDDELIYSQLVSKQELKAKDQGLYKFFLYRTEDEDKGDVLDVHVQPESGIKHLRDGRVMIFTDLKSTHADLSKPLSPDEYYNETLESSYYDTIKEYGDIVDAWKDKIVSDATPTDLEYQFERYNLRTPTVDEVRTVSFLDERGSYAVFADSYIELSSDTQYGGWFLQKYSKGSLLAREYTRKITFCPFDVLRKVIHEDPDALQIDHNLENGKYIYEVHTDDYIKEGTDVTEAPLIAFGSYREHHKAIRSIAFDVSSVDPSTSYQSGMYVGVGKDSTDNDVSSMSDGGLVYLYAGKGSMGGTYDDTITPATSRQSGRIIIEAGEIDLRCERLLIGGKRLDQMDKLNELHPGPTILSAIPWFGSIAEKVGHLLKNIYPVRIDFNKKNLK